MYGVIALLLVMLILSAFSVFGVFVKKLICLLAKKELLYSSHTEALVIPVIGAAALISLSQLFNLVLSGRIIAVIFGLLLIMGCIVWHKDLAVYFKTLVKNRFVLVTVIITSVLTLLPIIRYNELLSLHFGNNDIAFYLSSMEWLSDHSFIEAVDFSVGKPFYALAEYMTSSTRIGMDILGSVILSALPLGAHQIFLPLCAVFSSLCVFVSAYTLKSVIGVNNSFSDFVLLFLGSGCAIAELTVQQYAPQIFGVAFYIWFTSETLRFYFSEKRDLSNIIVLGLSLSALLAVYAEYASYAFIIFVIGFAVRLLFRRDLKDVLKNVIDAFKMLLCAVIVNISGFVIAVKFNLNVIISQIGSLSNIDPYHGNLATIGKLIGYIFGTPLYGFGNPISFGGISFSGKFISGVYIFLLILLCIAILLLVKGFISSHDEQSVFLMLNLVFYIAYWAFFRYTKYAYGEYKHIHLVLWLAVIILMYFVSFALKPSDKTAKNKALGVIEKAKPWAKYVTCGFLAFLSLVNVIAFYSRSSSDFRFDGDMAELSEAVEEFVPENESVGLLNSWFFDMHAMTYALRDTDRDVLLMTDNSYYVDRVQSRTLYPDYLVIPVTRGGKYGDILAKDDYTELWKNESFCIIKNSQPRVSVMFANGFSGLESYIEQRQFRTVREGFIALSNRTDNAKECKLKIESGSSNGEKLTYGIYSGDELIASGETGSISEIDIVLPENSVKELKITVNGGEIRIYTLDIDVVK